MKRSLFRPGLSARTWVLIIGFSLLYVPLVTIAVKSLRVPAKGFAYGQEAAWGWIWYQQLWQDSTLWSALRLSLGVGLVAALAATILGTMVALALQRTGGWWQQSLDGLTQIPLVVPELTMGLALLMWFTFLSITLGAVSLILAHTSFCLSYVAITVRAALAEIDPDLEKAARDLGATPLQAFWRVKWPLLGPAILSGFLMTFMISFDDFVISFYTTGPGFDTLPLKLYAMMRINFSPKAYALASLVTLTSALVIVLVQMGLGRHQHTVRKLV